MDRERTAPEPVRQLSSGIYLKHEALIWALRTSRSDGFKIPSSSEVVREAIELLARRELTPERFAELTGVESDVLALVS